MFSNENFNLENMSETIWVFQINNFENVILTYTRKCFCPCSRQNYLLSLIGIHKSFQSLTTQHRITRCFKLEGISRSHLVQPLA